MYTALENKECWGVYGKAGINDFVRLLSPSRIISIASFHLVATIERTIPSVHILSIVRAGSVSTGTKGKDIAVSSFFKQKSLVVL